MQAIISKYISPTNYRGARVKASCERGSITLSWPDELSGETVHVWAKEQLIARFVKEDAERYGSEANPWAGETVCGQIPSGEYVHVFTGKGSLSAYELSFAGRPVGAIGAFHQIKAIRWARSVEDATRLLYEPLPVAFEHITGVEVLSRKEGPK